MAFMDKLRLPVKTKPFQVQYNCMKVLPHDTARYSRLEIKIVINPAIKYAEQLSVEYSKKSMFSIFARRTSDKS